MRKVRMISLLLIVSILITSCRHKKEYVFMYGTEDISAVSAVRISFDEVENPIFLERTAANNISSFVEDFKKVDCYTYFGDPIGIEKEKLASLLLQIEYSNGDYELIAWNGQAEYTQEKGFCNHTGYSVFDEDQFKELIAKHFEQ